MKELSHQKASVAQASVGNRPQFAGAAIPKPLFFSLFVIVVLYLTLLTVEMCFRVSFPWDMLKWPESPFMTDMMKFNKGLPPYTSPGDLNSFVYSPGLEWLTFVLLKPFGLVLDIRFCRVVSVLIGMLAALAGTLAIKRFVRSAVTRAIPWTIWFLTWSLLWLVISTNFVSDLPHPDNLQALMAMSVFALCFAAIEAKNIAYAWATMVVAGLGVLTKQTGAICFLGPALVFMMFRPWGWLRWCMLTGFGLVVMLFSLYFLWLPESGRLFTLDVLLHQPIEQRKLLEMAGWLLNRRNGLLLCLALTSIVSLWRSNAIARRYIVCWCGIGLFAAGPNAMAYIKIAGLQNNLCLYQIWLFLAAWPGILLLPDMLNSRSAPENETKIDLKIRILGAGLYACIMVYVLALLPYKSIPKAEEYAYCRQIDNRIHIDIQGGRRLLVSHGTSSLINSGIKEPPFDRCNSVLEILNGNKPELLGEMRTRIKKHYYDKIYLTIDGWYGEEMLGLIHANYVVEEVIPKPNVPKDILGLRGAMIYECDKYVILKPAPSVASVQTGSPSVEKNN